MEWFQDELTNGRKQRKIELKSVYFWKKQRRNIKFYRQM